MNDLINDGQGNPVTRREYRDKMGLASPNEDAVIMDVASLYPTVYEEVDGPGFLAKSRKALAALVGGFAAAAGPLIVAATADGVVSWEGEIVPALIVGAGAGIGLGLGVWAIRND